MLPIHTLNARGHVMLEVYRDYLKLSSPRLRSLIVQLHGETVEILKRKKIDYADLRTALTPSIDKREAAFVFDSTEIESGSYGREILFELLPLLDAKSSQSLLCGDFICDDQELALSVLQESLNLSRSFEFKHSTLLYVVYINNISESRLQKIDGGLRSFPAYVGFIDTTFRSRAKLLLSFCMVKLCLKQKNVVLLAHEDDRSESEDINITHYPFEEVGLKIRSIPESYFGIFLNYKIERPVFGTFKTDTEIGLTALGDTVLPLDDCTVELDEAKYGYLLSQKLGKMQMAGFAHVDRSVVASVIKAQVNASYMYNLVFLEDHNVMKFNIKLELPHAHGFPVRILAALEYIPARKTLRVLTLH